MSVQRRLLGYFRPYRRYIVLAILCIMFTILTTLALPWIVGKDFIDSVILGEKGIEVLTLISLGIIGLALLRGLFYYGQNYLISLIGFKVVRDMRNQAYEHLQCLSLNFYRKKRTGEIVSRLVHDVDQLQNTIINTGVGLVTNCLMVIGILILIFYLHWRLSLFALAIIPLLAFTASKFGKRIRGFSSSIQAKIANISSILQETVGGIEVVKSFTREAREIERFKNETGRTLQLSIKRTRLIAALTPVMEMLTIIGLTGILWYGGREVIRGVLTTGELISFLAYIAMAISTLPQISQAFGIYQQSLASVERVFEVLDAQPKIKEMPGAIEMPQVKGYIEFKDVYFGYSKKELILEGINLEIKPGQRIALVGLSGAGKSSLVSLIPRFYDPSSGTITIDGYDIRKVKLASLRKQVGIVGQETVLFNGSIRDNIVYGKIEASDEEIIKAAKRANAHDFIMEQREGYETQVGERGLKLSGGERQRIALARAILKDPPILIFDEATSAVDAQTEFLIQQALERLMQGRSTITIAHRLSTVQDADQIVVLNKKKIEEVGSHQNLLSKGGVYADLYKHQFKSE